MCKEGLEGGGAARCGCCSLVATLQQLGGTGGACQCFVANRGGVDGVTGLLYCSLLGREAPRHGMLWSASNYMCAKEMDVNCLRVASPPYASIIIEVRFNH